MGRDELLQRVVTLLDSHGFAISMFTHTNSCFDIIARGANATLAVKVYGNIDAIRPAQAQELGKLGRVLGIDALIVGEKTKAFSLKDGTVYGRYGIPVLTLNSLRGVLEEKMPDVRYFKGRELVCLDAEKLKERRKKMGLTLEELAEKADSSAESMHRYEKGASATLGAAKRLERVLHVSIIRHVDIFKPAEFEEFDREMDDDVMRKIHDLGLELALFRHAPFRAYSGHGEELLIGKGSGKREVVHRALELGKTRDALGHEGIIIAKEFRHETAEGIPVVREDELDTLSKGGDLMKLMRERKGRKHQ